MDKVQKLLRSLTEKDRSTLEMVMLRLMQGKIVGLDVVKLKGYSNIFRARVGKFRIIYSYQDQKFTLITVNRRSEKTYKNL